MGEYLWFREWRLTREWRMSLVGGCLSGWGVLVLDGGLADGSAVARNLSGATRTCLDVGSRGSFCLDMWLCK